MPSHLVKLHTCTMPVRLTRPLLNRPASGWTVTLHVCSVPLHPNGSVAPRKPETRPLWAPWLGVNSMYVYARGLARHAAVPVNVADPSAERCPTGSTLKASSVGGRNVS